MPGRGRQTPRHDEGRDDPDLTLAVDQVRTDEKLPGLLMDHAVGWCTAHAFRSDDLPQSGRDFVKPVGGPIGRMGSVGHHPQSISPRHDGPDPALVLGIEHGQCRIDTAHLAGLGRKKTDGNEGRQ